MKNIMKIRLVALGLLLAMTVASIGPMLAATPSFSDVPTSHWAYQQISEMTSEGLITGYGNGKDEPQNSVSYGAFSLLVARAFYAEDMAEYMRTNNVSASTKTGVAILNLHDVLAGTRIEGKPDYEAGNMLTRDDMSIIMYNVLRDTGSPLPSDFEMSSAQGAIKDLSSIDASRRTAVTACYSLGLLTGRSDGTFGPTANMNRAQAAVVLSRLRIYIRENGGSTSPVEIPTQKPVENPVEQPKPEESTVTAPEVTDGPLFKMLDGENAQQMMDRINASTTYQEGYLTNGKPITEENIKELLAKFEETMPHGTTWTESFLYTSPKFGSVHACSAFGAAISDALFDETAPLSRHQNFSQLKAGDVVWMKNTATGYYHAFVIASLDPPRGRPSTYHTTYEGNVSGKVYWGGALDPSVFNLPEVASDTWIYSRY